MFHSIPTGSNNDNVSAPEIPKVENWSVVEGDKGED